MDLNSFWMDRRTLVTGGSGLIGGWLVEKLLEKGAEVVVLLRDWVPQSHLLNSNLLKKAIIVRGDLSDPKNLERILAEYEIKTIFHLAAQTIVPIANKNPLSTFESNIAGTWNLLEAARVTNGIESIVVASSDKAYGDSKELPYNEEMPLNAVYPYDVSKACADMISNSYAKTFGLPVAITRCGNFFGGGDLNWNRLIPGTIRSILRNQAPIIRSDGSLVRDYIYVEDAVSAYLTLAEKLTNNMQLYGEPFNFSNQSQSSVLSLTHIILKLMDSTLMPIVQSKATGEIKAQYLDANKASNLLGWKAHFGLEEGLKRTITWYQKHLSGDKYNELPQL